MKMFILKGKFEEIKAEIERFKEICASSGVQQTVGNIMKLMEGGVL